MPELPEVETIRLTLLPHLIGAQVQRVAIDRSDIIRGLADEAALLGGGRIAELQRHGKQLAIITADGRCVCVHLGMSGSLCRRSPEADPQKHDHVVWRLSDGGQLVFRDPRRFGGLWTFPDLATLQATRWAALGPDALQITTALLYRAMQRTTRAAKAALLDQTLVAGLGNIYVDEVLFRCGVHPAKAANRLGRGECQAIARHTRAVLRGAVKAGGSTLRDFVDGHGSAGRFQTRHRVYGRAAQPCLTCRTDLLAMQVAGRTTVYCPRCQSPV